MLLVPTLSAFFCCSDREGRTSCEAQPYIDMEAPATRKTSSRGRAILVSVALLSISTIVLQTVLLSQESLLARAATRANPIVRDWFTRFPFRGGRAWNTKVLGTKLSYLAGAPAHKHGSDNVVRRRASGENGGRIRPPPSPCSTSGRTSAESLSRCSQCRADTACSPSSLSPPISHCCAAAPCSTDGPMARASRFFWARSRTAAAR